MCHSAANHFNNIVVSAGNRRTSATLSGSPLRRFAQASERARPRAQQRRNPYSCKFASINNRRVFCFFDLGNPLLHRFASSAADHSSLFHN